MFGMQDIGMDTGGVSDSSAYGTTDGGFLSGLKNIGLNLAAGVATVGVQAFGKSQGVSSAYTNPSALAYNSALLTSRPGSVSPLGATIGVSGNTLVMAGLVLFGGLILFAVARRRG